MDGHNKYAVYRPWMTTYGAAASAGGSNKGMKGIVAGELHFNIVYIVFKNTFFCHIP